jgi:solute carrier family 25 citrate transporter 1
MSRNSNRKPVGFATHITAGGIAGACEAVCHSLTLFKPPYSIFTLHKACMSAPRHYQGSNATFKVRKDTWSKRLLDLLILLSLNEIVQTKARGFIATGVSIVTRETPLALYKGLGAVLSGIVPKMAIRFASFETYKGWLADKSTGKTSVGNIFIGMSRAVLVLS